jgi:hypothetical protein
MIKIFIEGKDKNVPESDFLQAILNHIGVNSDMIEIDCTGGYTNLLNSEKAPYIKILQANTDSGGKNLVVFDADFCINNGGFSVRHDELIKRRDELGLDFDLFLWPDNGSDGDVEVLMESIARKDLYPEFFDCFGKYERCISHRKDDSGKPFYSIPNRKGKLHTYFHSLPISNRKKNGFGSGQWRWSDNEIWNLDSDTLKPIKNFLSKYLLNG